MYQESDFFEPRAEPKERERDRETDRQTERERVFPCFCFKKALPKPHVPRKLGGVSSFSDRESVSAIFAIYPMSLTLSQLPFLIKAKVSQPQAECPGFCSSRWGILPPSATLQAAYELPL